MPTANMPWQAQGGLHFTQLPEFAPEISNLAILGPGVVHVLVFKTTVASMTMWQNAQ